MKIRALISFGGIMSMYKGEEREVVFDEVLEDLIGANYVEVIDTSSSPEQKIVEDTESEVIENQIDAEKQEIEAESTEAQQVAEEVEKIDEAAEEVEKIDEVAKEVEPTPEVAAPKAATTSKKTTAKGVK